MTRQADTLRDLILSFYEHGEKPAIITFGDQRRREWSYRELSRLISSLASGLAGPLEEKGRTVALYAGNGPEWVVTAMAVIQAGGILLPIDRQSDRETLRHILADSGAGLVFTEQKLIHRIEDLELPGKPDIRLLEDTGAGKRPGRTPAGDARTTPVADSDTAALFYTSGTTGPPKGVPLSHANLACQPAGIEEADLITERDRVLLPLPLHHVYPFVIGLLTPLALGLPVIFPRALTGREIIRAVVEGEASIIIGVPRLYRTLFEGIRTRIAGRGAAARRLFDTLLPLSRRLQRLTGLPAGRYLFFFVHRRFGGSLRVLASGGSPLDADLARGLEGLGWQVAVGYGLTETSPLLTINPPGSGRPGSVGRPVRGVRIRVDAPEASSGQTGRTGGTDRETGEVLASGPNVFGGYLHLDDKTRESFTDDGWFRTGDLGHFDMDGYLYLHGRAKTMIITESGEKVQPDEIEEAYASLPAIAEIGVFFEDGRLKGLIVPDLAEIGRQGGSIEEAVREAVETGSGPLPSFKTLSEYAVSREALSRTRLGKIRRHLLADRYNRAKAGEKDGQRGKGAIARNEMSDRDQALLEDGRAEKVWQWFAERYPDRRLTPDTSPGFDLGIDSLEWLDISLEIRRLTGVELSEEEIGGIRSVRDVLETVAGRTGAETSRQVERPLEDPESALDEKQKRWLEPLGPVQTGLSRGLSLVNRLLMRGLFRLRVVGRDNLPGGRQCVVTPNHLSFLDPLALAAALPFSFLNRTFFAGWTGIAFRNVLFRSVSRLARAVPIDDRRAVASSLAFGAAVLDRGNNLIWFPEGGRSPDGTLQEFKPGIGLLLEHHDLPVVPVAIKGTYRALPKGRIFPRFARITVIIGKPVVPAELGRGQDGETDRDRIRRGLRREVARLLDTAD